MQGAPGGPLKSQQLPSAPDQPSQMHMPAGGSKIWKGERKANGEDSSSFSSSGTAPAAQAEPAAHLAQTRVDDGPREGFAYCPGGSLMAMTPGPSEMLSLKAHMAEADQAAAAVERLSLAGQSSPLQQLLQLCGQVRTLLPGDCLL